MLRVVYRTVDDLAPGRLVKIEESRGQLDIQLHRGANINDITHALNAELQEFLAGCGWFQIWRGRIIGADDPESPLTVQYVTDPDVDWRACVQVRELRGVVRVHVCPDASPDWFAKVLTQSTERFLAGGQWFQLWQGEIVTMDPPQRGAA
ncbi:hypothetical protein ACIGXF_16870 [Streptomyces sp. NPDC053086]|uniref:hypothetical protein n=1 Tax=unclassified Streptomyces TaxID=2593676 RepID=UPI0037D50ABE